MEKRRRKKDLIFKIVLSFKIIQNHSKSFKIIQNHSKSFKIIQNH